MRPSIIFFDEIDGLAPVRSSRQDQIHRSVMFLNIWGFFVGVFVIIKIVHHIMQNPDTI